jgi:hypothetical protein
MSRQDLTLRCQTVVTVPEGQEEPVHAALRVTRELWADSERARTHARSMAREALRRGVAERTGRTPAGDAFDDVPVWTDFPDQHTLELLYGPLNGVRITIGTPSPPPWIAIDATPQPAPPDSSTVYGQLLDDSGHFFSRTEDGAWRYTPIPMRTAP